VGAAAGSDDPLVLAATTPLLDDAAMIRRTALACLLLAAATVAAGCGPSWAVIRAQSPNPLIGQTRFAVFPVDMSAFSVGGGSEADYLAEKDADSRADWQGDKAGINEEYTKVLIQTASELGFSVVPATGPQSAPYFIRPRVDFIEPGFYAVVASGASRVRMTILITTADGGIIDEVLVQHGTQGGMTNPAVGNRLRDDGEALGELTAEYLQTRISPDA